MVKWEMIACACGGRRCDDDEDEIPSEVVSTLKHTRRRKIVETLTEERERVTLVTLANRIATGVDDPLPDVVIELHDFHIPELTECGLITYDDGMGVITLTADPDMIEKAVEVATSDTNSGS